MLILDRTQRSWAVFSGVLVVAAASVYGWTAIQSPNGRRGGSLTGLIFGIIAALLMIASGMLAARRRFPAARLGSAQGWLRGHLWMGAMTVPFSLFHAGFGLGGHLEMLLWALFFAVILSGFWGLAMQNVLPKLMLENLPRETFIEQIPYLCSQFVTESDRLVISKCGALDALGAFETAPPAVAVPATVAKLHSSPKTVQGVARTVAAPTNPIEAGTTSPPDLSARSQVQPPAPDNAANKADSAPDTKAVTTKSKPDPSAMLAAARAKKAAAAESALVPPTGHQGAVSDSGVNTTKDTEGQDQPKPKADPKAMLAAARAKKELAANNVRANSASDVPPRQPVVLTKSSAQSSEPVPVESQPDAHVTLTNAPVKTDIAKEIVADGSSSAATAPPELNTADGKIPSRVVTSGKPDAKAMLAAAKAKKAAEAGGAVPLANPETPIVPPSPNASSVAAVVASPVVSVRDLSHSKSLSQNPVAKLLPPTSQQLSELKQFYIELVRPFLPQQRATKTWHESIKRAVLACRIRRDGQHPELAPLFETMQDFCEQREQFHSLEWYHFWLHRWLLIHIPATVALYFILVVHIVMALRVVPLGN